MHNRKCHCCGRAGGLGKRELRPYGPNGSDICAGCVFGEGNATKNSERLIEAKKQLDRRFMHRGPLILNAEEEVGPRPMSESDLKGD